MNIRSSILALAGTIRTNFVELLTLLAIIVGLPAIAFIYVDERLAFSVLVLVIIALGFFALRNSK